MRALLTGVAGQDGTLLSQLLASHGFEVLGIVRPGSQARPDHTTRVLDADLTDEVVIRRIVADFRPDQVYHLAAAHHSSERASDLRFDKEMVATNFRATEVLISTIADVRPQCRILFAASSQMYCPSPNERLSVDENTPMQPSTLYGLTKSWGRELLSYYRENRGLYAISTILFNHESSLRSPEFVTRKISIAAARAKLGAASKLQIRDISGETDWSSAHDVVKGMRLALSAEEPLDYVLGSGAARSVGDALEVAFKCVGLDWKQFTTFDPPRNRQCGTVVGNAARARAILGWRLSMTFDQLLDSMVASDLQSIRSGELSLN